MSKHDLVLEATLRADVGKGASRRLRRLANAIPAIIYGAGEEPTSITLDHDGLFHATENEAFFASILTIKLDGKEQSVIIKDLQRHPAKPKIMHADFQRVSADQEIHVNVPLHFLNEDTCPAVKLNGGQVGRLLNELEISCLPKDLPEYIEVDLMDLEIGESLHISDLKLPAGVSSIDLSHGEESDLAVVAMNTKKTMEDEDAADADAPESAEGAEGAEGAEKSDDE